MKKQSKLLVGLIGVLMTSQISFAAAKIADHPTFTKSLREYIDKTVDPHVYGSSAGKVAAAQAGRIANDKILAGLKLSMSTSDITAALSKDGKTTDEQILSRLDAVKESAAAIRLLEGSDSIAANNAREMAQANLKLIAALPTMGNGNAGQIAASSGGAIKAEHVTLAQEAINRLVTIKTLKMGETEMADYKTLEKFIAEFTEQGLGVEAATVKAIQKMKKCSYDEAVEYLKKIKGCKEA